jgi:hypothetical protein
MNIFTLTRQFTDKAPVMGWLQSDICINTDDKVRVKEPEMLIFRIAVGEGTNLAVK